MDLVDLPPMPMPGQRGSDYDARWERDLSVWVHVCQKIISKNPKVQPPPMPQREDFGQRGSYYDARYEVALQAWQSIWVGMRLENTLATPNQMTGMRLLVS